MIDIAEMVKRLQKVVDYGQERAGTLPARDSVKVWPEDWHAICDTAKAVVALFEAEHARAEAAQSSFAYVRVKPPEWVERSQDRGDGISEPNGDWEALATTGSYYIGLLGDRWSLQRDDYMDFGAFNSPDEAKAAAQADYEQRIRSALDIVPSPSFADGIEAAASWHDEHVVEERGPDWGMASDDIRTAWRSKNLWHRNAAASLRALDHNPRAIKATHRHKKRGTEYVLIGYGRMQAENWRDHRYPADTGGIVDMREVAIYRSATDPTEIWVRPREEFEDGRFEEIKNG